MHKILITFEKIISLLYDNNLVIGGAQALLLHGLKMSRTPEDVDIILYEPTKKQWEILNHLSVFDIIEDRPFDSNYPIESVKAFKFKKNNCILDVVIEHKPLPEDLLFWSGSFMPFKINSVENIIAAKAAYFFNRKENNGLAKYSRQKDLVDLIDLKNQNFNI